MIEHRKIKVLIVDDSAIVRRILSQALSEHADIEVVGTAPDPYVAREKLLTLQPDVLTLDIEMPRMDGLTFLKKLMPARPMPVIVISSLAQSSSRAAIEAMQYGAVEVLAKPGGPYSVGDLKILLPQKVRSAARARIKTGTAPVTRVDRTTPPHLRAKLPPASTHEPIILIGASTGGTEAIADVLVNLPADSPPVVVVQHIPAGFSRAFSDRLDSICHIHVKEAEQGDHLSRGLALVAPGNRHMRLRRSDRSFQISIEDDEKVCYQRPSVDVLFRSAVPYVTCEFTAAILTGMGSDGAAGMLELHRAGAHTIAQDEQSCVVFGMPREAIRMGGVDQVLPLHRICDAIVARSKAGAAPKAASQP